MKKMQIDTQDERERDVPREESEGSVAEWRAERRRGHLFFFQSTNKL